MADGGMPVLARATVSIIPNMKGAQATIAEQMGGAAEKAGKSGGKTLGKSVLSMLGSVISVAAIASIIKKAFDQGAAFEQALGGVETMFGDSANKVVANAQSAFKRAGVSANEYMEQVTSFSATLLQGLGQDTEAAAKYADMAIVDMADNANKFGTDIASIQNAYQGFAKDNYTMLDNLKLGYGGTASEMARLINDSGVLGDTIEVTASTVKDVPFDKIIEAIHKTQEGLKITGATAAEAETTFSGSFASMRASLANLLTAIAVGGDVTSALNGFASTVSTFILDNMLPMLMNILNGIPAVVFGPDGILPRFIAKLPEIIKLAGTFLNSFATALFDAIKKTDWIAMFKNIVTAAATAWGELVKLAGTIMANVWSAIKKGVASLVQVFNFKWELPKIKLPHVKITGSFSLVPPKVPKFSIDWYDKGGIFSNPTIIGVGERRPEFVGALDDLRQIVRDEAGGGNVININVYGAEGQSVDALADAVMDRIQAVTVRKGVVFG